MPSEPDDAGGGNDRSVPVGAEASGDVVCFDQTMLLSAMAIALDGVGGVCDTG